MKNTAFQITHCGAMDGDGRSSKLMRPINRSQPTTRKTVWTATFQLSLPTGFTSKAIRFSNRNENAMVTLVCGWCSGDTGGACFRRIYICESRRGSDGDDFPPSAA